jgi:hypothetical protein
VGSRRGEAKRELEARVQDEARNQGEVKSRVESKRKTRARGEAGVVEATKGGERVRGEEMRGLETSRREPIALDKRTLGIKGGTGSTGDKGLRRL